MIGYRDDRDALHQRVDQLEGDLDTAAARSKRLDTAVERSVALEQENEQLRLRQVSGVPAAHVVLILLAVVILGAVGGIWLLGNASHHYFPEPPERSAHASPRRIPPPAQLAPSCRCPGPPSATLGFALGAFTRHGPTTTHYLHWRLMSEGDTGTSRDIALQADIESAPPMVLEGGNARLAMACVPNRMVLALGQRSSAWDLGSGAMTWSVPLPAPVGELKNGALAVECAPLAVTDGKVVIPTAAGTVVLDPKDGRATLEKK